MEFDTQSPTTESSQHVYRHREWNPEMNTQFMTTNPSNNTSHRQIDAAEESQMTPDMILDNALSLVSVLQDDVVSLRSQLLTSEQEKRILEIKLQTTRQDKATVEKKSDFRISTLQNQIKEINRRLERSTNELEEVQSSMIPSSEVKVMKIQIQDELSAKHNDEILKLQTHINSLTSSLEIAQRSEDLLRVEKNELERRHANSMNNTAAEHSDTLSSLKERIFELETSIFKIQQRHDQEISALSQSVITTDSSSSTNAVLLDSMRLKLERSQEREYVLKTALEEALARAEDAEMAVYSSDLAFKRMELHSTMTLDADRLEISSVIERSRQEIVDELNSKMREKMEKLVSQHQRREVELREEFQDELSTEQARTFREKEHRLELHDRLLELDTKLVLAQEERDMLASQVRTLMSKLAKTHNRKNDLIEMKKDIWTANLEEMDGLYETEAQLRDELQAMTTRLSATSQALNECQTKNEVLEGRVSTREKKLQVLGTALEGVGTGLFALQSTLPSSLQSKLATFLQSFPSLSEFGPKMSSRWFSSILQIAEKTPFALSFLGSLLTEQTQALSSQNEGQLAGEHKKEREKEREKEKEKEEREKGNGKGILNTAYFDRPPSSSLFTTSHENMVRELESEIRAYRVSLLTLLSTTKPIRKTRTGNFNEVSTSSSDLDSESGGDNDDRIVEGEGGLTENDSDDDDIDSPHTYPYTHTHHDQNKGIKSGSSEPRSVAVQIRSVKKEFDDLVSVMRKLQKAHLNNQQKAEKAKNKMEQDFAVQTERLEDLDEKCLLLTHQAAKAQEYKKVSQYFSHKLQKVERELEIWQNKALMMESFSSLSSNSLTKPDTSDYGSSFNSKE